jgi:hypothetical protein
MIEFAHAPPTVDVAPAEYQRLLGYPRDWVLEERASELAAAARDWYAEHGRPWVYARQAESLELADGSVRIDGTPFVSERLLALLSQANAESVILVAASAGPELERQAQQLWREEKPDEYFFLEVYGSAVVEHLITMKGAELCAWADARGEAILPHYSPGYPEWDIAQQPRLLNLIRRGGRQRLPGDLESLDSGMLRPKKSLLGVFGLTRERNRVARLSELNPCESCSYLPCQYRRAPYLGVPRRTSPDDVAQTKQLLAELLPKPLALARDAQYSTNAKALARWAATRLAITPLDNGTIDASFRYEGTTCSNLGRPLFFDYHVTLGPREEGYVIRTLSCRPTAGDEGYKSMCRYLDDATHLMSSIDREQPLLGEPLNSVLNWNAPHSAAGCYCELADRMHKWRLVLETIHFALVERELRRETFATTSTDPR